MQKDKTIFEKIVAGELSCDKVFENERILAFHDISPQAPVHILIIPKKHYQGLHDVPSGEISIVSEIAIVAQQLAEQFNIADGYRLLTNNGQKAGQTVFHLHFHLLGGRSLSTLG